MTTVAFKGFPRQGVQFFQELERHNDKGWFHANRDRFERFVLEPARSFVEEMGMALQHVAPAIHSDPRIDGSIFRIYRDIRFSPDKRPFKTHLGIFFWEGNGPRMSCPGFYFELSPRGCLLGGGHYVFDKQQLDEFRESVVDDKLGTALTEALQKAKEATGAEIIAESYKRVPRGYPTDHPRAHLLIYKGMCVGEQTPIPAEAYSEAIIPYCMKRFEAWTPLHRWVVDLDRRAAAKAK